jgi:O-antigen/teichoic acid export membrane protein
MRSAVGWSFGATALRFGSSLFLLPLILRRVPPEELGLWYVFVSLGFLAPLLDFGFAPTIVRSTSFLWAGARRLLPQGLEVVDATASSDAAAEPPKPNLPLLGDLVASLRVYYLAVGITMLVLLVVGGGAWIWHKTAPLPNANSLRLAFLVYACAVGFNFINGVWLFLLGGVNGVRESQQISVGCGVAYFLLAVTGLLCGYRLWALVMATFAIGVLERVLGRAAFYRIAQVPKGRFDAGLIRVLWPNAWRAGAVSFGAFMVVHANTLICSAFLDLETTASYGLSLQALSLVAAVSTVWITVKLPIINQLRAQHRVAELAALFKQRIQLTILTYFAGGACLLWFGGPVLDSLGARTHLLPFSLLALFLLIQFLETHHSMYGALVISENVNPFLKPALISGVAVVALSLYLTPKIGVLGMLLSAGLVQLCYNNWWPILRALDGLSIPRRDYWRFWIPATRF